MTEVEKVSIGGYAFTLEKAAYTLVRQYLDELEAHYAPLDGGSEVMEGFEERMAELLYERCGDDGVASEDDIQQIIDILGKPSAIESEDDPQPKAFTAEDGKDGRPKQKKRLYRDPTNKMIGGVCSGLAAYFKIDVVLIRIVFIGLFLLTGVVLGCDSWHSFDSFSLNLFVPVLYVILWIAMPEARTVQQRWELGISNPPAGAAAAAPATAPASQPVGSGLGRVLRIVIGCLLLLTAVCGLTFGLAALFGQRLFDWNLLDEFKDELAFNAPGALPLASSVPYRIAILLTCFLPFVGMLYGGIMMLFDLRTPRWRPGLVIFLLWIIALTVFTVLTLMGLFQTEWI
ncbi:MAG: PspC domain-containing protein [Bacteroidales bacterium]|nr:PspC domain-containing protein [Bacteroidales bacterium]